MSRKLVNAVDVEMCWDTWLKAKPQIVKNCSESMTPDPVHKDGCIAYFDEIAHPHWKCMKSALDDNHHKYRYIDRSDLNPIWIGPELDCPRCDPCPSA